MIHANWTPQRILLGAIVILLLLAGTLLQSTDASAGFSTSPGAPRLFSRSCHGEHIREATL
jgi:hypothetical protein